MPHSVLNLFVASKVEGRIPINADGWETHYLPPDTDPATVDEVKAALDRAMQIEIDSEKPEWYLSRLLVVVIPSLLFFLLNSGCGK